MAVKKAQTAQSFQSLELFRLVFPMFGIGYLSQENCSCFIYFIRDKTIV